MENQKYTNEDYERDLQERYYNVQRKSLLARHFIANGMGLKASIRKAKEFERSVHSAIKQSNS